MKGLYPAFYRASFLVTGDLKCRTCFLVLKHSSALAWHRIAISRTFQYELIKSDSSPVEQVITTIADRSQNIPDSQKEMLIC